MSSEKSVWQRDALVLIPAAGGSRDVLGRKSDYPAALVRLNSKPIICLTIEYLIQKGFTHFRIGVPSEYLDNFTNVLSSYNKLAQIELLMSPTSGSAISTLKELAKGISTKSSVLINLGDTFCKWNLENFRETEISILIQHVAETERWSTVHVSDDGTVEKIFEKSAAPGGTFGICGVYWWQNGSKLISDLLALPDNSNVSDLLNPRVGKIKGVIPELWCDSDHSDMLEHSRRRALESREFNKIEIDEFRGVLKKSSKNVDKLSLEIDYYNSIPEKLKVFFPRMLAWQISQDEAYQELEFYSYPTLSELFCYENVPNFIWKRIFEKLEKIVFHEFLSVKQTSSKTELKLEDVFITKIKERNLKLSEADKVFDQLTNNTSPTINGILYRGVREILEESRIILEANKSPWTFIHGDFCLTNILCEPNSNNIKLIDPRGGFDGPSTFGPQLYDVAKLSQSIIGRYDLIIADQFSLNLIDPICGQFGLEIRGSGLLAEIQSQFNESFLRGNINPSVAKLVGGLVLLSNPIFHLNKPDRAIAMTLQGIILINDAILELS